MRACRVSLQKVSNGSVSRVTVKSFKWERVACHCKKFQMGACRVSLIFKLERVACHCKKFNSQGCQKFMLYITQGFDVSKNAIFQLAIW